MDSSVGIATGYGLGGTLIESRWGGVFPNHQTGHEVQYASYKIGTGSSPWVRKPRLALTIPPSSAEFKERVMIFYSPPPLDISGFSSVNHIR
jgi:hypothetical protein